MCLPLFYPSPLGEPKPTLTRAYPGLPGLTTAYLGLLDSVRLPGLLKTGLPRGASNTIGLWTDLPCEMSNTICLWMNLPCETSYTIGL